MSNLLAVDNRKKYKLSEKLLSCKSIQRKLGLSLNLSPTPLYFGERLFKVLIINSVVCYESLSPK
jgi:hypothetical protein